MESTEQMDMDKSEIIDSQKTSIIPIRNRPGTKSEEWYSTAVERLLDLEARMEESKKMSPNEDDEDNDDKTIEDIIDEIAGDELGGDGSSFAVQQYLQLKLVYLPAYLETQRGRNFVLGSSLDIDQSDNQFLIEAPDDQDEKLWLYEHMRLLCLQLNEFVSLLQNKCIPTQKDINRASDEIAEKNLDETDQSNQNGNPCQEMKAGEWAYLCASHSSPQSCSAIDYIVHTLDAAIAVLNSAKLFPSRISVSESSTKHFQSISRRLYRIFAHTWYHHRILFDEFEKKTRLYERMLKLSKKYDLVPDELIVIPQ